jgi:Zn-dependent protease with chaperone function
LSGIVKVLAYPLQLALLKWYRSSELTADRAGLLASGDLRAALSIDLKFASGWRPGIRSRTQLDLPAFVEQARRLAETENSRRLHARQPAAVLRCAGV